jgi:hypothetical protein
LLLRSIIQNWVLAGARLRYFSSLQTFHFWDISQGHALVQSLITQRTHTLELLLALFLAHFLLVLSSHVLALFGALTLDLTVRWAMDLSIQRASGIPILG